MTAFALALPDSGRRPDWPDAAPVAAALSRVYGTPAHSTVLGGCVLVSAPVRPGASGLFVDPIAGLGLVGQVMLEDRRSLRLALGRPADGDDLSLVAAAYSRWGAGCTSRLRGEFAFALWDDRQRLVLAARDGFGVRLAFVASSPRLVLITNILSAAVASSEIADDLDDEAIAEFLAEGSLEDGRTVFRAVRTLPAGHALHLGNGATEASLERHWWFPQPGSAQRKQGSQDIVAGYRAALEAATTDRLADGGASILLSGGIDSTTIAAAARHAAPAADLRAFTAGYERLPSHDELSYARAAADRLRIPLVRVRGDSCEPLDHLGQDDSPPMPLDEPTLSDWRVLLQTAAGHSTAGLYGEDGDSLFLPPGWRGLRRESSVASIVSSTARFAVAQRRLPYLGLRLRERIGRAPDRTLGAPTFLSVRARRLFEQRTAPVVFGQSPQPLPPHPTRPLAQWRLCSGAAQYLAPLISPDVTRAPLEIRLPLLDSRVVQFVVDTPAIPWCQRKYLPRCAYRGDLPAAVIERPKQGVVGLHEALVAGWRRKWFRRLPEMETLAGDWIDVGGWKSALASEDVFEVGLAWRAIQLHHWLARRRVSREVESGSRCTA